MHTPRVVLIESPPRIVVRTAKGVCQRVGRSWSHRNLLYDGQLVDKNFTSAEKLFARTDINHEVNEGGWTPLHLAVDNAADAASQQYVGHGVARIELGLIRLLLRHGADPSAVSDLGQTPVSLARGYGRSDVAELLRAGPPQETNA
jgi:ankyrin repeat protein